MAFPSVTYTFSNSTTADATQVNQNFTDLINAMSDGTKSVSLSAVAAAGAATLLGNVTLGNSSSNSLTINASLSSSIPIGTDNSYDIGSSTFGLRAIYFGANSQRVKVQGSSSMAGAVTFTYPPTNGTSRNTLASDGSGNTYWTSIRSPQSSYGFGISASVATNALTITLNFLDNTALSSSQIADFMMRSATAATGTSTIRSQTANLTITVPSGASLGQTSGANQYVWVYILDDAGTLDLCVSGVNVFSSNSVQAVTTINNAATSGSTLYSASAHTGSKPILLVGRILLNEAAAGTWATAPTEIVLNPTPTINVSEEVSYTPTITNGGTTSTNTAKWSRWGNRIKICGVAVFTSNGSASTLTFTYPSGVSINSSNLPGSVGNSSDASRIGDCEHFHSGSAWHSGGAHTGATGTFQFVLDAGTDWLLGNALGVGDTFSYTIEAPISGWSTYGP